MADMKVIMKENIPEFLQVYPHLEKYLEAVGESFEIKRQYIKDFDKARDPKSATDYGTDKALKSFGFEIPANIKPSISRNTMRDAMSIFAKKGTTDSLVWALRAIGIQPTVRQAWLPSPDSVMRGKIIDPLTGEESNYELDAYSYNDFLYGDVEVTPEGNFFKGYRYNDPNEQLEISGLPIKGEVYKTHPSGYTTDVVKVPYVAIRIEDENFNVVTGPYTDEDGNYYEYGVSEEYQSALDLIEYFLYDLVRPTPVRILLVSSSQELADIIGITSDCRQKYKDEEVDELDSIDFEVADESETLAPSIATFPVGENPMVIGGESPYYNPYMGVTIPPIGEGLTTNVLVHGEDMGTTTVKYPLKTSVKVPIKGNTKVVLDDPTDLNIYRVYTISEWDSQVPRVFGTLSRTNVRFDLTPLDGVAFYLLEVNGVPSDVNIDIEYSFE